MDAETKYAKSGDVHIAYRVFGDGPRDIVLVPGTVSHVELYWELPANAYLLRRLASFARVIVFDKRGQGLSDRNADLTLPERVGDLLAVMDATGSRRATIYGWSEGGQMSLMFAATHPERVEGLVLYGTYASIDVPRERFEQLLGTLEAHWGEGILVHLNAPSRRKDAAFVKWFGRLERAVASPGGIIALFRANYEIDVRPLLPSIRVPTLILHREQDALVPVAAGRLLAEQIPGAKYVELPGGDHLLQALDQELLEHLLDTIEEFVTGERRRSGGHEAPAPVDDEGPDDAIAELERYREILAAGESGDALTGVVARAEAIVAAARGSWSEAEAQFLKAAETFRRHGMVWQEAQTFRSWGHALSVGANRREAVETLDRAIEVHRRQHDVDRNGHVAPAHTNGDGGAAAPSSPRGLFRREGDYWSVSWRDNVMRLKDAKGLHYIAYLLAHPGRQFLASDLATAGTSSGTTRAAVGASGTAADLGDAGASIDAKARSEYRARVRDLTEDLAEAIQRNDNGRAARLRSELEFLREQISASVGLGGRTRRASSHAERARLMVTKAIKAALTKIRAADASLGRHLATSIKTGHCCAYDPGPKPPVAWDL
jgi:pimeloyl-ACP methyl ester carboxylesterase